MNVAIAAKAACRNVGVNRRVWAGASADTGWVKVTAKAVPKCVSSNAEARPRGLTLGEKPDLTISLKFLIARCLRLYHSSELARASECQSARCGRWPSPIAASPARTPRGRPEIPNCPRLRAGACQCAASARTHARALRGHPCGEGKELEEGSAAPAGPRPMAHVSGKQHSAICMRERQIPPSCPGLTRASMTIFDAVGPYGFACGDRHHGLPGQARQ